jgi:tripartite ATP-independent transporter DctM subunit
MIGVLLAILFGLLALGLPVAVVLVVLGLTLDQLYGFFPVLPAVGDKIWGGSTSFALIAVPLFILTGEILLRSGIAGDMFHAIDRWVRRIPGGLLHTNIATCALFSATSGSSVASAATVGTVAIPQMKAGGYRPSLFLGSIAAGGTLGILIPPSINLILYGVLAEVSVARLYLAALIPGILLALLFSLVVLVICVLRPEMGGTAQRRASWREKFAALPAMLPPLLLFLLMVGSIYAGIATPTEAAALGTIAAMGLAAWRRRLSWAMMMEAFERTLRTTCMVMLIVLGAMLLHFVIAGIGLSGQIRSLIDSVDADPLTIMLVIILIYLVLGCFMETLSLMIATTPIVVPIIVALGYDPIWFGVLFMILIEAALITPPIGVNLFVVQSVRGGGPFRDVTLGSLPFLLMMLVMLGLLLAFPQLALWLPEAVRG